MCGNVGDWVMMLGQTPHHRPPDTHSSLGEITGSMLATLHIHLPPWAKMKALHIGTCAKMQQSSNKANGNSKIWLFGLKLHASLSKIKTDCMDTVGLLCTVHLG